MRVLYIVFAGSFFCCLFLWLGWLKILTRKRGAVWAGIAAAVASTFVLLAVLPGNSFYGPVFAETQPEKKIIALTFDDGPYPPHTQALLNVLDEEQAKVTFFMVAQQGEKYPELVRQAHAAGHEIALHCYVHKDFLKLDAEAVKENITRGKASLEGITGEEIKYFRPPHGFKDWQVMRSATEAKLQVINWSVMPKDWTKPGAEVIADRVLEAARPGAIVLLHDGDSPRYTASREQTVMATRELLRELRRRGYSFVTVSELLAQKPVLN